MSEQIETNDKQVTHLDKFREQIIIRDAEPILTTKSSSKTQHDLDNISPGTLLCERYEISKFLGKGGMSVVYQAHDTTTRRTVALKIIRAERLRNQDAIARAIQEAKTVVPLFHKNIAQVVTTEADPDYGPILVMEFIEGSSITAYLSTFHGTRQEEAIRLCIQVCNALEYTHTHGIVHRDIKPSNVMVATDGIAKVIDFGIAKIVEEDDKHIPLTQTNEIVGTSAYMSPEQCFGQPADVRCDVYQVGCLLFELLTGKPPFEGKNSFDTMYRHVSEQVDLQGIDSDLQGIISRTLSKNPADRYESMTALKYDLMSGTRANKPVKPIAFASLMKTRIATWISFSLLGATILACIVFTINLLPTSDTPIELLIDKEMAASDFKTSEAALEQASKLAANDPSIVKTWNQRGEWCFRKGDYGHGSRAFDLARDPYLVNEWNNLGTRSLTSGEYAHAVRAFNRAHSMQANPPPPEQIPNLVDSWNGLSEAYLGLGNATQALQAAQNAGKLDGSESNYLKNMGAALTKMGKSKESISAYKKASMLDGDDSAVWAGMAQGYLQLRKLELAENCAKRSLELGEATFLNTTLFASVLEQENKLSESEKYYRKSLELEISQPDAWTGLRNVLNKQGKHSEANAAARKAQLFAQ